MKLVTFTPYALDMNYGRAVNECFDLLGPDDWAIVQDHDAMFTTREWYRQLSELVAGNPRAAFTCVTNRIASRWQQAHEVDKDNHDMVYHRQMGTARLSRRTLLRVTHTRGWGGVMMCLSKAAWAEAGGFPDGLLCVDHGMFFGLRAKGYEIYAVESILMYHWRRANGDDPSKDWPKAANCPCRGLEPEVNERISIEEFVRR